MRLFLLAMSLLLCPVVAGASVTRLQIDRREVVLNGQPFGAAGPYEKLAGKVHFALDPALPQNRSIVDLNLAPKNAQGLVEFSGRATYRRPRRAASISSPPPLTSSAHFRRRHSGTRTSSAART